MIFFYKFGMPMEYENSKPFFSQMGNVKLCTNTEIKKINYWGDIASIPECRN